MSTSSVAAACSPALNRRASESRVCSEFSFNLLSSRSLFIGCAGSKSCSVKFAFFSVILALFLLEKAVYLKFAFSAIILSLV